MPTPDVQLDHITKHFGVTTALDDVSLAVEAGEFLTLLGPSGCGKTTLLRTIGGFVLPDAGTIRIQGTDMGASPPHQRPTAMVFQRYALFPHLTVDQNVGYGLKMRRTPTADIRSRVAEMLALVDLPGFGWRLPDELSGGQQQRVALARALILQPTVLLLDEPLAALDANLRRQMQDELLHLQRQTGITFIAVTHDQEEALVMSSRIAVMNQGRIEQIGTPAEVFDQPRTRFVAHFMGAEVLSGTVLARDAASTRVRIGRNEVTLPATPGHTGDTIELAVRPSRIRLNDHGWPATVIEQVFKGTVTTVYLRLDDGPTLRADIPHDGQHAIPTIGNSTHVAIDSSDIIPLIYNPKKSPERISACPCFPKVGLAIRG